MTPSRDVQRLVEIMAALRDPEDGCPWDIVQTPESIVPYTIEETYEVVDAIERGSPFDLREELGDLLLQVVYHARFAEERGEFDFGGVVEAITRKMVRRHPHVFGTADARDPDAAKASWDRIKAEEKRERAAARRAEGLDDDVGKGWLDEVPRSLPPLAEALAIQKRMAKVGFDWATPEPILDKIDEETGELREAVASGRADRVADELGDLLFTAVNLARRQGVDPELALRSTCGKARRRFAAIERDLATDGLTPEAASLERMDEAWDRAKLAERNEAAPEPQSSGS